MVKMLVRHQNNIALGHRAVIRLVHDRIHMDHQPPKRKHERAVANERDRQLPLASLDDILFKVARGHLSILLVPCAW